MAIEVVALAPRSSDLLIRWEVRGSLPAGSKWQDLRARLEREMREGRAGTAEIYFRYLGPPFENHDHHLLETLVAASKEHTPGSRTHAVFDPRVTVDALDPTFDLDSIKEWYATALREGLDDVLEFSLAGDEKDVLVRLLRSAHDRSRGRERFLLRSFDKFRPWSAVLAERLPVAGTKRPEGILDPYVFYGPPNGTKDPLVVVVRNLDEQAQGRLVERVLEEHAPERAVVALLNGDAADDLKALCQRLGLGDPLPFRGILELRYFLARLNFNLAGVKENSPAHFDDGADEYSPYEEALDYVRRELENQIGTGDPQYREFLAYELRLRSSVHSLRRYGNHENRKAELNEVTGHLDRLTLKILETSFTRRASLANPRPHR